MEDLYNHRCSVITFKNVTIATYKDQLACMSGFCDQTTISLYTVSHRQFGVEVLVCILTTMHETSNDLCDSVACCHSDAVGIRICCPDDDATAGDAGTSIPALCRLLPTPGSRRRRRRRGGGIHGNGRQGNGGESWSRGTDSSRWWTSHTRNTRRLPLTTHDHKHSRVLGQGRHSLPARHTCRSTADTVPCGWIPVRQETTEVESSYR